MARMQRREPNVSAAWPTLGVAVAAVLWGIWWMPLRALEAAGLSGDWSSVFVYTVAAVALLPVAFARRRQFRAGGWPVAAAGVLYGVALVTWNHALIAGEVVWRRKGVMGIKYVDAPQVVENTLTGLLPQHCVAS